MLAPTSDKPMNSVSKNGHQPTEPASSRPDPQVKQRAPRRRFTAEEKLRLLKEADACKEPGQLGALLRREGLYSSTLLSFRKQKEAGKLGKDPKQAREQHLQKEAARQRDARKIAALEAENKKLTTLLELQKKVAELIDWTSQPPTD